MLYDWEILHGLSPSNAADAMPDGDGLINLHEYWAGTDPLTPDGSNTLLSVASRSIDEYWAGTDPNDPLEDGSGTALVAGSRSVDDRIAGKQPDAAKPYYNGFCSTPSREIKEITFTLQKVIIRYCLEMKSRQS